MRDRSHQHLDELCMFVPRHLHEGLCDAPTGIVDQHVDMQTTRPDLREDALGRSGIREVVRDHFDAYAMSATDLVRNGIEPILASRSEHEIEAVFCEQL